MTRKQRQMAEEAKQHDNRLMLRIMAVVGGLMLVGVFAQAICA